ncbi:MAG: radical SAM protein [Candidatus Caldarchaeum sp.]
MNKGEFSVVPLNNGFSVVLNPYTFLWVLATPSQVDKAKAYCEEMYDSLKDQLEKEVKFLTESVAVDFIELHLTSRCNMNCAYCYVPRNQRMKQAVMCKEEVESIICKLAEHIEREKSGIKRVIFHGGEPLLAKDSFFPIIDKYYKDFEFGIQTNGTLMTEDDARFIKERNVHVSFSLDGPSAEVNDITRHYWSGKGTFNDVARAITLFKNYEWTGVIVTITKYNVDKLDLIAQRLYDWGVPSALFNPVSPSNSEAASLMPPLEVLTSNYKRLIDALIELNDKKNGKRLVIDNVESLIMAILTSNFRVLYCHSAPCGAGRLVYVISSNGDVYPCSEFIQFKEFRCGNIFKEAVSEILNSEACNILRCRKVDMIEECKSCAYRYICGANCPASVYGLYRHMLKKTPYCTFQKEIISYIFEKISESGLDVAYKLVSKSFEDKLRRSEQVVHMEEM